MTSASVTEAAASLKENGKTFWLASRFLPKDIAADAAVLYAFCRTMDDLADQQAGFEATDRLLRARRALHTGRSDEPAVLGLLQLADRRGLDLQAAECLLDALLNDASGNVRIQDQAELLRYCYGVAGTVGLMMSAVLQTTGSAARVHAIDLGIAMQLTNIARDVQEDACMGRRYLPSSWVGDLQPEQICAASPKTATAEQIKPAMQTILDLADVFYAGGAQGFSAIPAAARKGIRMAAASYRQIGVELRGLGCDFTRGRVVVSLPAKLRIAARLSVGSSDLERLPYSGELAKLHDRFYGLPGFL